MTCIVGWIEKDDVHMGADSLAGNRTMKQPKVWKTGEFIIGTAGDLLGFNIIRNHFIPPKLFPEENVAEYMATRFVDALREVFKAREYEQSLEPFPPFQYNQYLVGVRGRLFEIRESYCILECAEQFSAIGSGKSFALGNLKTLESQRLEPEERILKALEVSAFFDINVAAPFNIISTKEG